MLIKLSAGYHTFRETRLNVRINVTSRLVTFIGTEMIFMFISEVLL